ncbi:N-acetylmuramoyl-L-alanine amidase [Plantactinospora sp. WMMC1484]|uniref:N-acetylmuramoyl-L-alanine amidase n=1 Tax=Plantactinospora sp. WMMC1484 TaxID=3404122 RepID=UPI003BF5B780
MSDAPLARRRVLLAAAAGIAAVPLLAVPAQAATPKIYLDAGHGGTDTGAVGNGLQEKALTLDIALRTRTYLQNNWTVSVRMSRTTDITRSLAWRTDDANAWGANIFVSIHINAGGGTGFESYIYPTAGAATQRLQDDVHAAVLSNARSVAPVTDRGQKTANFHVLRETVMAAILTENLFVDRAADANLLGQATFRQALAVGHAQGIARYFGLS